MIVFVCSALHNAILWKNPHIRFMKLELPLALGLLSLGCWLFINWPDAEKNRPKTERETPLVGQANFQEAAGENAPANVVNAGELPVRETPSTLDAGTLIASASSSLAVGPPVEAQCRMRISLFDQVIAAQGRYFESGIGQGKLQRSSCMQP